MAAPGTLQNPYVLRWLDGLEPAWTLLDGASFNALRKPPSQDGTAIQLATDLTPEEVQPSTLVQNALILLNDATVGPGLKLTVTGNLSRSVVTHMVDVFTCPDFDREYEFRLHKVVNEPDFLPLFFIRHLAEAANLVRKHNGYLKITSLGRRLLEKKDHGAIWRTLFQTAFWEVDLSYMGRDLHGNWPLYDVGIILWSLSVAAGDWQTREHLTRFCTIPTNGVIAATWDSGTMAMEARILRPLWWFGLLSYQQVDEARKLDRSSNMYRKASSFDRFLMFDVSLEIEDRTRH